MINFDKVIQRENTNCYKYDLRKTFFGTDDITPMWVADMDFAIAEEILDAIKKRLEHPVFGYTIRSNSMINAIAQWMKDQHQWEIKKNWILLSPGVVPSLAYCVQAYTKPGDKIIIQPPVYHPFQHTIEENGCRVLYNPLKIENGRYTMDFDKLERDIDEWTRMIFLCSPHNPGGTVWKKEELERLAEICERKNIIVVADEIHSDLVYGPHKHIPFAKINERIAHQTITLNAPSKTFNIAGLGASFIVCSNDALRDELKRTIQRNHAGMINILGLTAMEAAYNHGHSWVSELKKYLQKNRDRIETLLKHDIPALDFMVPEATFLFWLNFSSLDMSADQSKKFLIEKAKLGFNDGRMFGPGGDGWHRLNFGTPFVNVENAIKSIKRALDE